MAEYMLRRDHRRRKEAFILLGDICVDACIAQPRRNITVSIRNAESWGCSSVGRAVDFNRSLCWETFKVNPLKLGETLKGIPKAIPSQAWRQEGVET
jgi:hypothetical protein